MDSAPPGNPGWYTLDRYLSSAVLLDQQGCILFANSAWRQFMRNNGGDEARCGVGVNYLKVCEQSSGEDRSSVDNLIAGIRSVLAGRRDWYEVNYPCHSPTEQRWFRMRVEPYADEWGARLLVLHSPVALIADPKRSQVYWAGLVSALETWLAQVREIGPMPDDTERERLERLEALLNAALDATRRRLRA